MPTGGWPGEGLEGGLGDLSVDEDSLAGFLPGTIRSRTVDWQCGLSREPPTS